MEAAKAHIVRDTLAWTFFRKQCATQGGHHETPIQTTQMGLDILQKVEL